MKTLCVPITRGLVVRNILNSDVFKILREKKEIKFIFLVLEQAMDEFKKDFNGDDIEIIPIKKPQSSHLKSLYLKAVARNLVWTESSKIVSFRSKDLKKHRDTFFYKIIFNSIGFLGKFKVIKKIFRYLESAALREKEFDYIFEKYKIDLMFLPDIHGTVDTILAKAARHFGIKSIGMTRGWDSLCQRLLRAVPDRLIVQNELVKKDAMEYQAIPQEKIIVSGFPQFDLYKKEELLLGREEYCKKMNLDPNKKIIFFGSSGNWSPNDRDIIKYIYELANDGQVPPASLIVRPHFSDVWSHRYAEFYNLPDCRVDDKYTLSNFLDNWNPSPEDIKMFVNTINYADLFITFASTLVLDAAAVNKPIINLCFGGQYIEGKDETLTLYRLTHYQAVMATGGAKLVYNKEELAAAIKAYLSDPSADDAGRAVLREKLCFGADGLAGERIAGQILKELNP